MNMDKDIRYLKGVGEARAASFAKMNIHTVGDLLYLFPRTYEDRTQIKEIADCIDGETVCVSVTVFSPVRETRIRKNMTIYNLAAYDDSGSVNFVWYNNKYVKQLFSAGDKYIFYGKVSRGRRGMEMVNPVYEKAGAGKYTGKIIPVYPLTAGLMQKNVQSALALALDSVGDIPDPLPPQLREHFRIAEINYAMRNIHFPDSFDSFHIARRRFVFEELFILQLALLMKKGENTKNTGIVFSDTACTGDFIKRLPFALTGAQQRTVDEILADFSSGVQMSRLVQGDVGSGKTAVAAAAVYCCVKNGYQAVMMAPTEILAAQHFETFRQLYADLGINVVFLSGGLSAKEKRFNTELIKNGLADVIIGTNAVIQESVEYARLGLVIADEQHRFGVEQRSRLLAKGTDPHMLIMSATPIPRTLALILYGDLSISVIDELPPGRKPVKTYAVGENMRRRVYAFMEKNLAEGGQCYVVCPLIEETQNSDLNNAIELTEKLRSAFPQYTTGLMHGRMKPKEKDAVMDEFAAGRINILVSTTVIEVGVNVPNSNIMIIENAERFGLSQLHQLRGRVGRGSRQSFCILFAHGNNDVTKKRMQTMCQSNDGFYISEQDLKLRGPGDFFGTRQHGLPEMKIANLFEDADILQLAQKAAQGLYKRDPALGSCPALGEKIRAIYKEAGVLN